MVMKTNELKVAIAYETRLVRRNWLYRLFLFGAFAYVLAFLAPWDARTALWWDVALASSVALRGVFFLNLFQSVVVAFLACDLPRRRRRAESREVLSVRPLGNVGWLAAEFLGLTVPFFVADVVFTGACVLVNALVPDTPFEPLTHVYYLLTHVLPTLVFVAGLSTLANRVFRHPLFGWLLLALFLYGSYAWLSEPLWGALDFCGSLLPDSRSTLTGFVGGTDYLLQRGAFLLLGVGLLFLSAPLSGRLSSRPGRDVVFLVPGALLVFLSLALGGFYVGRHESRLSNRESCRESYQRHAGLPKARVSRHEITYRPDGDGYSATSRFTVRNPKKSDMEKVVLYLNPGLEVRSLESGGEPVPYERDRQVLLLQHLPILKVCSCPCEDTPFGASLFRFVKSYPAQQPHLLPHPQPPELLLPLPQPQPFELPPNVPHRFSPHSCLGGKNSSIGNSKFAKISQGSCSPPTPLFEQSRRGRQISYAGMSSWISRSRRMIENWPSVTNS